MAQTESNKDSRILNEPREEGKRKRMGHSREALEGAGLRHGIDHPKNSYEPGARGIGVSHFFSTLGPN